MKDRILLLNPPAHTRYIRDFYCSFSAKANYYWPPQDLLALSGILRKDYEVEVLDAIGLNLKENTCFEKIMKNSILALLFTTGAASFEDDLRFVEKIKKDKNAKIIGTSSLFRFKGKEIMERYAFLDALLTDFTDKGILYYLKGNYKNCDSMFFREDGQIHIATDKYENSCFSIGVPRHELFVNRSVRIPLFGDSPFSIVVGSTGCNFNCKFCVAGTMKLRTRVLAEIFEELKYIYALGIKKIFFVDPNFTADKHRILEFCVNLQTNNLKIEWVCNAHPNNLEDKDLLKIMKDAGCMALFIGVESANDEILKKYNKGTHIEQIRRTFSLCHKVDIKTLAYFIIGLPGEDDKSIRRTIEFAKEINCDYASFGCATADIGTELRREALEKGWIKDVTKKESFDSSMHATLETDRLKIEDTKKMQQKSYREFYLRPRFIIKKLLEAQSLKDIRFLLKGWVILLKRNIL